MNVNIKNNFSSIEQMASQIGVNKPKSTVTQSKRVVNNSGGINTSGSEITSGTKECSFGEILKSKQEAESAGTLRFSKHANQRLASRNIDLSSSQLARLENGANKAREKGIKESLVMVDDLAFIVNVPSKTVVTAVNDADEGVFTNIDGAVIS